jgi:inosine/xanthosine triphosphate pyrophosphatase family protein
MAKAKTRITRSEDTAEAKVTKSAKQAAAAEQFAAADAAVVGDDTKLRMAALGGL